MQHQKKTGIFEIGVETAVLTLVPRVVYFLPESEKLVVDTGLFGHIERFAFVLVTACAQQQRTQQEYQFSHNKHHGFGF